MTKLPANKTKIVCTIGPASESPEMMRKLLEAGMNVARLNFSHGDFSGHAKVIANLRAAAKAADRRVAILADLPGPKMRIGTIKDEPVELIPGATFTMTTEEIIGDAARVSVSFTRLPQAVKPGDTLFLNDGLIQLEVVSVGKNRCHLPRCGGRRAALAQGTEPAGHRSRASAPSPSATTSA